MEPFAKPFQPSRPGQPGCQPCAQPRAAAPPRPADANRSPEPAGAISFWDGFARRHGHELARCVARAMMSCGWRPDADDVAELVQEVYCRLLAARAGSRTVADRPPPQQWAYLQRIARSVVVDQLRARCARKRGGRRPPPAGDGRTLDEPAAPGLTPEQRLLAREGAEQLRRRVRELFPGEHGERNLRVLELAAVEGMTSGEISRRLAGALSPSSVHTVLHRIRRQLGATAAEPVVSSPVAAAG
jgi:RNA polymerase sigma factor (sigma-70 family)